MLVVGPNVGGAGFRPNQLLGAFDDVRKFRRQKGWLNRTPVEVIETRSDSMSLVRQEMENFIFSMYSK